MVRDGKCRYGVKCHYSHDPEKIAMERSNNPDQYEEQLNAMEVVA